MIQLPIFGTFNVPNIGTTTLGHFVRAEPVLAVSAAGFLAPVILSGSGREQSLLSAAVAGPPGLIVGMFLALLIQIGRALSLPMWSKTACGLILLLLLFPFFSSVLSVSSFVFSIGTAEISGTEQRPVATSASVTEIRVQVPRRGRRVRTRLTI